MKTITLSEISVDELITHIEKIFEAKVERLRSDVGTPDEFMSRLEVASLLNISLPTLCQYTKQEWLRAYKIGNRVLYNKKEVLESIKNISSKKFKKSKL